jgi:hypothetical protein
LREQEIGPFGELSKRANPGGCGILQIPPFESLLRFLEKKAGRKLTLEEIEIERAAAPAMVVSKDAEPRMALARAARNV